MMGRRGWKERRLLTHLALLGLFFSFQAEAGSCKAHQWYNLAAAALGVRLKNIKGDRQRQTFRADSQLADSLISSTTLPIDRGSSCSDAQARKKASASHHAG
jgi:hypothetical protein